MAKLTDYTSYADAQRVYATARLWELFDGDRDRFNIGHECVDRHAVGGHAAEGHNAEGHNAAGHHAEGRVTAGRVALRVAHAEGADETITFADLAAWSSRFAHWLAAEGIAAGDRVAIMLEPSLPFYAAMFGAVKRGAIAVPLFTLFGAEGVRLRVQDCTPRLLLTTQDKAAALHEAAALHDTAVPYDTAVLHETDTLHEAAASHNGAGPRIVAADAAFMAALARQPAEYHPTTTASDLAIFQYTSGTTRELPAAIKHTHRALVVLMNAALYGTGLRPGDRFFCPSSPAWGHGLWHGTLAPLALGIETGAYGGRFSAERLLQALHDYGTTNLSAAATHYRMIRNSGRLGDYRLELRKLSFTGEPIDPETAEYIQQALGVTLCSMYGTTEVGVVLANYPGAADFVVRPGSLGRPVPGVAVEVQRPDGTPCEPGEQGEIMVRRHDAWFPTKDRGRVDGDGYFYHAGRADDVIISAGWTMSAVEIEHALLLHPAVQAAAVIGVPDALRGLVVKAFIVPRPGHAPGDPIRDAPGDATGHAAGNATGDALVAELQDFVRRRLSQHEYPRQVAFVAELPRTPAGKINRKALRDQEAAAASALSQDSTTLTQDASNLTLNASTPTLNASTLTQTETA